MSNKIQLCYTDTGGTFTDCMLVDEKGNYTLGKAPTTPEDLSEGYFNAVNNASKKLGLDLQELFSQVFVAGYGTTIGTNTLLTFTGARVGLLITKGFEHLLLIERGIQTWTGYNMADIIQGRTHRHTTPLVPLDYVKPITERIDCLGNEVVPLYEREVTLAINQLLDQGVEAIALGFIYSWMNSEHERRAGEIAREIIQETGKEIPVFLRSDICPRIGELGSINATIVEAYIGHKTKKGLHIISDKIKANGFKGSLEIMLSLGGLTSVDELKAVDTLESGPVGAPIGARYIGQLYAFDNLIATDVGGTSFDAAIVTRGAINLNRQTIVGRLVLGIPMLEVESIGAGGGTLAWIDPNSGRLNVGPESAGAQPGPVCYDRGGEIPTVTDADVVLGYINPEYFLGGRIKLNKEKAADAIRKKVAEPLGMDLMHAAMGIRDIIDLKMKDKVLGMALSRGLDISNYHIMGFGGAGATHICGYTSGVNFKGVMTFPYASVFCALGAAAADYEHRLYRSANIIVSPTADDEEKLDVGSRLNLLWEELEEKALRTMKRQGFPEEKVQFTQQAMMRYGSQLDDLIVPSPTPRVNCVEDWEKLAVSFQKLYERTYARSATYGRGGYEILEVGIVATVPKIKPVIPKYPLQAEKPPEKSKQKKRRCFFGGEWFDTAVFIWEELQPGNRINGPAIWEHETTTLVIPPGRFATIDEYLTTIIE